LKSFVDSTNVAVASRRAKAAMHADVRVLDRIRATASDVLSAYRGTSPAPREASKYDLYLSPHFDDVCFSLAAYVSRKRQGIVLTVFSNSKYVSRPADKEVAADSTAAVSALRRAEDLTFVREVGMRQIVAGLDEAPIRGRDPFDSDRSAEDAILLDQKVMNAITAAGRERPQDFRPRLYCPMGIGAHIDHLTILRIVKNNIETLRAAYRLAYYEDLHYASDWQKRMAGLAQFRSIMGPLRPRRSAHPIGDTQSKLRLVALYQSQFVTPPNAIGRFTPAHYFSSVPHEAIWT
jgi:hypothetical protein